MTDPRVFYNKEDLWRVAQSAARGERAPMTPYYTIMKLAEVGTKEEFILMVPFTPARKDNMIAWMAARCDEPNYGKVLVFTFPKQKLIYGPQQIESRIDQSPTISQQLTLWDQRGSNVIRGTLLVIPVLNSVLYVEPLYLAATDGRRAAAIEACDRRLLRPRRHGTEPGSRAGSDLWRRDRSGPRTSYAHSYGRSALRCRSRHSSPHSRGQSALRARTTTLAPGRFRGIRRGESEARRSSKTTGRRAWTEVGSRQKAVGREQKAGLSRKHEPQHLLSHRRYV